MARLQREKAPAHNVQDVEAALSLLGQRRPLSPPLSSWSSAIVAERTSVEFRNACLPTVRSLPDGVTTKILRIVGDLLYAEISVAVVGACGQPLACFTSPRGLSELCENGLLSGKAEAPAGQHCLPHSWEARPHPLLGLGRYRECSQRVRI